MPDVNQLLERVAHRATDPARRRTAETTFLGGRTAPIDRLLVSTYFQIAARSWRENQDGERRLAAIRAGMAAVPVPPGRVVDLGCGAGGNCAEAASRWPDAQVVGYDASSRMIAQARGLALPSRVRFVRRDVTAVVDRADLLMVLNFVIFPGRVRDLVARGGHLLVADSFHHRVPAMRAGWEAAGLEHVDGADVEEGFFEVYRVV